MYLIPKNIKMKREIFKGIGLMELVVLGISMGIGFLLQSLVTPYQIKIILFFFFPLITFLLILPLPNGSTSFIIFKKFLNYQKHQKKYKLK